MARKSVSVNEETYAFLKKRAAEDDESLSKTLEGIVEGHRTTRRTKPLTTDSGASESGPLNNEEIDEAQGYEAGPNQTSLRTGLSGLFATSQQGKDIGTRPAIPDKEEGKSK